MADPERRVAPPKARTAARQGREDPDRRRQILTASMRVFASRGYLGATMRDIASEAALSPGLIYYYCGNKDELYGQICEEAFKVLLGDMKRTASQDYPSEIARLVGIATAYVRYYLEHPEFVDILSFRDLGFKKVMLPERLLGRIEALSSESLALVQVQVARCVAEGSVRPPEDLTRMTMALWACVEGLIFVDRRGYLGALRLDINAVLSDLAAVLTRGVQP
jgi:AcrR family transcriptional regulator